MENALLWYTYIFVPIILISVLMKIGLKILGKYEAAPLPVQVEEMVTIPFMLFGFISLYGYLFEVAFFSETFWKYYVVLFFLQQLTSFWMPKQRWIKRELKFRNYVLANLVSLITSLPLYYMLYQYAFVSFPIVPGV